jgi:hypothetical protein
MHPTRRFALGWAGMQGQRCFRLDVGFSSTVVGKDKGQTFKIQLCKKTEPNESLQRMADSHR